MLKTRCQSYAGGAVRLGFALALVLGLACAGLGLAPAAFAQGDAEYTLAQIETLEREAAFLEDNAVELDAYAKEYEALAQEASKLSDQAADAQTKDRLRNLSLDRTAWAGQLRQWAAQSKISAKARRDMISKLKSPGGD